MVYIVRPGDTLQSVAARFGGSPARWIDIPPVNPLRRRAVINRVAQFNPNLIVGEYLNLPTWWSGAGLAARTKQGEKRSPSHGITLRGADSVSMTGVGAPRGALPVPYGEALYRIAEKRSPSHGLTLTGKVHGSLAGETGVAYGGFGGGGFRPLPAPWPVWPVSRPNRGMEGVAGVSNTGLGNRWCEGQGCDLLDVWTGEANAMGVGALPGQTVTLQQLAQWAASSGQACRANDANVSQFQAAWNGFYPNQALAVTGYYDRYTAAAVTSLGVYPGHVCGYSPVSYVNFRGAYAVPFFAAAQRRGAFNFQFYGGGPSGGDHGGGGHTGGGGGHTGGTGHGGGSGMHGVDSGVGYRPTYNPVLPRTSGYATTFNPLQPQQPHLFTPHEVTGGSSGGGNPNQPRPNLPQGVNGEPGVGSCVGGCKTCGNLTNPPYSDRCDFCGNIGNGVRTGGSISNIPPPPQDGMSLNGFPSGVGAFLPPFTIPLHVPQHPDPLDPDYGKSRTGTGDAGVGAVGSSAWAQQLRTMAAMAAQSGQRCIHGDPIVSRFQALWNQRYPSINIQVTGNYDSITAWCVARLGVNPGHVCMPIARFSGPIDYPNFRGAYPVSFYAAAQRRAQVHTPGPHGSHGFNFSRGVGGVGLGDPASDGTGAAVVALASDPSFCTPNMTVWNFQTSYNAAAVAGGTTSTGPALAFIDGEYGAATAAALQQAMGGVAVPAACSTFGAENATDLTRIAAAVAADTTICSGPNNNVLAFQVCFNKVNGQTTVAQDGIYGTATAAALSGILATAPVVCPNFATAPAPVVTPVNSGSPPTTGTTNPAAGTLLPPVTTPAPAPAPGATPATVGTSTSSSSSTTTTVLLGGVLLAAVGAAAIWYYRGKSANVHASPTLGPASHPSSTPLHPAHRAALRRHTNRRARTAARRRR